MGFGETFLRWLAILLQTASTKVSVNGVPGKNIRQARGLRQGDPISPTLFILCMEVLTALVSKAVQDQLLSPISGISALQRVSIYADDVVLFTRPLQPDLLAIRRILDMFGEASGLHINYEKSTATMIRGSVLEEDQVRTTLRCKIAKFPIKYLGLQLALRPLTKAEWQPMVDKAIEFMPAWQKGLIARPGRLTLVKTVIAARAVHQLLVMEAPTWALEEVQKCMRSFFWAGKKKANGGQCLVSWEQICTPVQFGGLGVKDLRLQGIALRTRWQWLRRTDPDRPWQGLPMMTDRDAYEVFQSLVKITVGDGKTVRFWRDRWIEGESVEDIAPLVFSAVSTRRKNCRTVEVAMTDNRWTTDLTSPPDHDMAVQLVRLWYKVNCVQRDIMTPDVFSWPWSNSGQYSAKSTYAMLCHGRVRSATSDCVWKSGAPLKCQIFGWLALQHRVWTSDRRARHGLQDQPSSCFTCLQEEDNIEHILVQCVYAREVWHRCLQRVGLQTQVPHQGDCLEDWWLLERQRFQRKDRKKFDRLISLACWSLWKQRNSRVFNGNARQLSALELVNRILDEFLVWVRVGVGGGVGVTNTIRRE
jgi:hypothetical protein